jgi:hypothetical protein
MGWSLKIESVAGTAVRIHITFLLFLAWIYAAGKLIGLVTSETIGEMLMVHRATPTGLPSGPWGRPAGA